VTAVNSSVGAQVSGGGNSTSANSSGVISLLNPNQIRIDASVDQTDVSKLKPGQTANVTFDALSGYTYTATVSTVGLVPTTSQGVVSYVVSFAIDTSKLPAETPVPSPGMTGSLTVTTASVTNALVVPTRSVTGTGSNAFVTVKGANGDERRQVTAGISNGTLTEITSGLQEGEEVVYTTSATSSSSSNSNQPQTQFGGPGGGPVFQSVP
jgi:hypothetical protein